MKKTIMMVGLSSLIALTGCSGNQEQGQGSRADGDRPSNVNNPAQYYDEDNRNYSNNEKDDFGFTRSDNATINGRKVSTDNTEATVDREQLSDLITRLSLSIPNVQDVSTLVTDEEVLVVYETDTKSRMDTADQVKRTAMSIVPRYYHVYVSDDKTMAQDIENFAQLEPDSEGIDYTINKTIKRMLKSPQGYRMSDVENENGEMPHDKNERASHDPIRKNNRTD